MDESLIMEIWDTFKEYIPEKNKDNAARQYVDYLLGKEISAKDLEAYLGYDTHLDDAITDVVEHSDDEEEEFEEDSFEDDEDY